MPPRLCPWFPTGLTIALLQTSGAGSELHGATLNEFLVQSRYIQNTLEPTDRACLTVQKHTSSESCATLLACALLSPTTRAGLFKNLALHLLLSSSLAASPTLRPEVRHVRTAGCSKVRWLMFDALDIQRTRSCDDIPEHVRRMASLSESQGGNSRHKQDA